MTKAEALYQFFNSFDIPAYPSNSVPLDTEFPWLTYQLALGNHGEEMSITASLWYHTDSEAIPNAKAEEIAQAIGLGGVTLSYDGGLIWIKRGTPWCMSVADEADRATKVRQLNIELEYM